MTVNTGTGDGTLALELLDDGTIKDAGNLGLSGTFPFVGATPYTIEKTAPTVVLPIGLTDPVLTGLATVHFTVNFSEPVVGSTRPISRRLPPAGLRAHRSPPPPAAAAALYRDGRHGHRRRHDCTANCPMPARSPTRRAFR